MGFRDEGRFVPGTVQKSKFPSLREAKMRSKHRRWLIFGVLATAVLGFGLPGSGPQMANADLEARAQRAIQIMQRMGLVPMRTYGEKGVVRDSEGINVEYVDREIERPCPEIACWYITFNVYIMRSDSLAKSRYDFAANVPPEYVKEDISAGSLKAYYGCNATIPTAKGHAAGICGNMWFIVGATLDVGGKNAAGKYPTKAEQEAHERRIVPPFNQKLKSLASQLCANLAAAGLCSSTLPPPSGDRPPTPGGGAVGKDDCQKERLAMAVASLKARMSLYHLETVQGLIAQLEKEWLDRRDLAFWTKTADMILLFTSVAFKPLTGLATAGITATLADATLKGVMKEGLKQYILYFQTENLPPGDVLEALAAKGGKDAAKKAFEEFVEAKLTDLFFERALAGEMGGFDELLANTVRRAGGSVDDVLTGAAGGSIPNKEFIRKNFAGPTAKYVGVMLSLYSALDGAWDTHKKLESLRQGLQILRDEEILLTEEWDRQRADLDAARAAFNQCVRLHPEAVRPGDAGLAPTLEASAPSAPALRREAETVPPGVSDSVTALGLQLELVEGRPQVRSVTPGSSAEKFHVAKGWILVLVNDQPAAGLTLAQLRERILATQGRPLAVIEFVLPDGTSQRVLLPVRE